jgi:hypothetical protein
MAITIGAIPGFPDNAQGTLVPIPALPDGATVDEIFYFQITVEGTQGYYKRVLNGPIRATECLIVGDGETDNTERLQAVLDAGVTTLIFDDPVNTEYVIEDEVTVPSGVTLVFANGNYLSGAGTLNGGVIVCNPLDRWFDITSLTVSNLLNGTVSVCWFGAVADYYYDGTTPSPTDNYPIFTAALNAMADKYGGTDIYYYNKGKIYIPAGPSARYYYYLSDTFVINAECEIYGDGWTQTRLKWPNGCVGIELLYPDITEPISFKGGSNILIHDLALYGSANAVTDGTSHGIAINTNFCTLQHVIVTEFLGDGVYIRGGEPTTNANNAALIYVRTFSNSRHGIYISGPDANNCLLLHCDASGNGAVGFNDEAFLGNKWIACHADGNGIFNLYNRSFVSHAGSYWICIQENGPGSSVVTPGTDDEYWYEAVDTSGDDSPYSALTNYVPSAGYRIVTSTGFGTLDTCYHEGGEYALINQSNYLVTGGNLSDATQSGVNLIGKQGILSSNNFQVINSDDNDIRLALYGLGYNKIGINDLTNGIYTGLFYDKTRKTLLLGPGSSSTSPTEILSNGSTITTGRVDTANAGRTALYGMFMARYNLGDYRFLGYRTTMPSTADDGEHAAGDCYFYSGAEASFIGWRCVTGTTTNAAGTWIPIGHHSGVTGSRPSFTAATNVGYQYFDTTLGYPIWWSGSAWVKYDGTAP